MFETNELGRTVNKADYEPRDTALRTALLDVQHEVRERDFPVIIVISGVEGAGKGAVINELHRWFDARGVQTHAFWDHSDEEQERPRFWRYWRRMPPKGVIGIMLGAWYVDVLVRRVRKSKNHSSYARDVEQILEFERLLAEDGALVIKFWLHLGKADQAERARLDKKNGTHSPLLKGYAKNYRAYTRAAEALLQATDQGHSQWHIIEAADWRYRNLAIGETLLQVIKRRLASPAKSSGETVASPNVEKVDDLTVLDTLPMNRALEKSVYQDRLSAAQNRLSALAWKAHERGLNTICVFEGWDAAGKGGAIRRLTKAIDARLYRVISIAAPTEEERAQHYLWRFWRHVPRAGYCTIYDRSWYGRVLVERVENYATSEQWLRAYQEINDFEQQLVDNGTVVLKFWLNITPEEQLRRFKERQRVPWKQYKITPEDWRNRDRWDNYKIAVHDMVARTSTTAAPWTLIAADDKRYARVNVIETLVQRLEKALD